jgi:hypothetical protein
VPSAKSSLQGWSSLRTWSTRSRNARSVYSSKTRGGSQMLTVGVEHVRHGTPR